VPAICQAALPHLSGDPDGLFDALAAAAVALDPAPVGVQYARLFEWLRARAGARLWVERSGGSLRIVSRLRRAFPAARFVHIVRDGRDTALSMSRHAGFRMVFAAFQLIEGLGVDPMASTDRRWEGDLSDELAALLPERFTREAFARFDTPPPLCAHYWSGEISQGLAELAGLGEERLLTIRYEDLLGLREGATECAAGADLVHPRRGRSSVAAPLRGPGRAGALALAGAAPAAARSDRGRVRARLRGAGGGGADVALRPCEAVGDGRGSS
jgi:hypothetical protein